MFAGHAKFHEVLKPARNGGTKLENNSIMRAGDLAIRLRDIVQNMDSIQKVVDVSDEVREQPEWANRGTGRREEKDLEEKAKQDEEAMDAMESHVQNAFQDSSRG